MVKDFIDAIAYPFRDTDLGEKLLPIALISLIPVVGFMALLGWQHSIIRHIADGHRDLPTLDYRDIFLKGALIFVFVLLYGFIPLVILSIMGISGIGGLIDDFQVYSTMSITEILKDWFEDNLNKIIVLLIWGIVAMPLFYSSLIRSALIDDPKAFLNLPASIAFLVRNIMTFVKFYIFGLMLTVMIFAVDVILGITGLGLALIPVVTAWLYFIMTSYELGRLAEEVRERRARREARSVMPRRGASSCSRTTRAA